MKLLAFCKKHICTSIFCGIALLCIPLKLIALLSAPFADFFNRYIASIFRAAFAHIFSLFPFSVAETAVLVSIPLAILFIVYTLRVSAKQEGGLQKQILRLVCVIAFLFSSFMLNFGIAYDVTPIEEQLGFEVTAPTDENLYLASAYTLIQIGNLQRDVTFKPSGQSEMPYGFSELTDKLNDAYDTLYERYAFLSPLHTGVKRIASSKPMTYTHLSGMYTPFTGEANVNINYPDYIIAFSTAHEMAHQRGVAAEDAANFIAYLACTASEDPYLQYAAHANMMEYLGSAVRKADPEGFASRLLRFYPDTLRKEYAAYGAMFKPYAGSIASTVSDAVNDAYLKVQGEEAGTASYGLVTDLAVAYILTLEEVPK